MRIEWRKGRRAVEVGTLSVPRTKPSCERALPGPQFASSVGKD